MSIDRVKKYFKEYGIEDRIIELEESTATVALAAEALHCTDDEIAKTLSFELSDRCILIVLSGLAKLDNHKFKEFFHEKSKMLDIDLVEEKIGHAVGGVCPFGINPGIDVYLDVSLKKHDYLYPACGNSKSAIKLSVDELEKYSNAKEWIDVSKDI